MLHPSQRLLSPKNHRSPFSLRVILNHELLNELLRFGSDLSVLAPPVLKEMMAGRLAVVDNVGLTTGQ